jgi:hypothetical protein
MATLKLKVTGNKQLQHILKAEEELCKAGIYFDTGSDLGENGVKFRDWELDSIEGAELKPHKGETILSFKELATK